MSEKTTKTDSRDTCGDYGGKTLRSHGDPCTRPAGWGTDRQHGSCSDHIEMTFLPGEDLPEGPGLASPVARREYAELYRALESEGLWRPAMEPILRAAAMAWERMMAVLEPLQEEGVVDKDGEVHPLQVEWRQMAKEYRHTLQELRLTPVTRNRLPAEGLEPKNPDRPEGADPAILEMLDGSNTAG